jgi:hypothetical protein
MSIAKTIWFLVIFFVPLVVLTTKAKARNEEKPIEKASKKVQHNLKVERSVEVRLTNKYGKINVSSWDKDSIKLMIEVSAVAKTKEEAEKILQRVHTEPVFDEKYFILTTEISEKQGGNVISQFIDDLTDKAKSLIDKTNVEINLTILIPERAKLNINNKYGDVSFEKNFKGNLQLTLAYGNLSAGDLPPFANLNLQSGKAFVGSVQNSRIALKYGELNLRNADRLYLESSSSEINIDEIKDLDVDSRNDDFDIITAYSLTGKTSLSKVFVQEMHQKARLEMQGGSFKVRTLKPSFEWIDIQSKSTDIKITPEESLVYQLDISGTPKEVVKNDHVINQGKTSNNDNKNSISSLFNDLTNHNSKSNPLNSHTPNPQTNIHYNPANATIGSKKVIKINATGGQIIVR